MRRLLVINPNTSESVTQLLRTHVQASAGQQVEVNVVTVCFGAPYIACEASDAVAAHATLDAWATVLAQPGRWPDAVLIGCFGDLGLLALRESAASPVTGLAEAAFILQPGTGALPTSPEASVGDQCCSACHRHWAWRNPWPAFAPWSPPARSSRPIRCGRTNCWLKPVVMP